MTKIMPVTSERLLVAIDVAKRSHDVLVRWPDGRTRTFKVQSKRDGFEGLTTYLLEQGQVGNGSLQAWVLLFEFLQPPCLVKVESAVHAPPPVIKPALVTLNPRRDQRPCLTDAFATGDGNLNLPELVQDLLRVMSFSWHFCLPSKRPVSDFSIGYV